MAISSQISKLSFLRSNDPVILEKLRWSIRQRLRKQMSQLITDLFDAADDFLFSSGQKGQFGDGNTYLGAMRELRAKQKLFEDRFLDEVIVAIKASYRTAESSAAALAESAQSEPEVMLEQVELDLAMEGMARKAARTYQAFIKQIASLQKNRAQSEATSIFASTLLNDATLQAFGRAQAVLTLPLEIRLVFIKLFEQNFLLNMEKLYLDIISIINNAENKKFVDKLYASSTVLAKRASGEERSTSSRSQNEKTVVSTPGEIAVSEETVEQVVAAAVGKDLLPEIVSEIVQRHWKSVLLLIGVNKGKASREWQEAMHTLRLLVSSVSQKSLVTDADRSTLLAHLEQGFELIQVPGPEQEELFTQLTNYFIGKCAASGKQDAVESGSSEAENGKQEVSISPTGEEILNQEDLDDLAQLLGACDQEQPEEDAAQELSEILPRIDALAEESTVQVLIDGKFKDCTLQRNISNPSLYTVCTEDGSFCLNRSRLGLAIALREGELRLKEALMEFCTDPHTLVDSGDQTRH